MATINVVHLMSPSHRFNTRLVHTPAREFLQRRNVGEWLVESNNNIIVSYIHESKLQSFFCSLQQISVTEHAQNKCFQHRVGTNGKITALNAASQKYVSIETFPKVAHTWGKPSDAINKGALQLYYNRQILQDITR